MWGGEGFQRDVDAFPELFNLTYMVNLVVLATLEYRHNLLAI